MGRWEPEGRRRLQLAALELFTERGFEGTTVAEIAERAGLTERTFFRHFTDKREVMFAGSEVLAESLRAAIAGSPPESSTLDAVAAAIDAFAAHIPSQLEFARKRYAVIEANLELRERENSKMASLGETVATALIARGVKATSAHLAADMAVAVFRLGFRRWIVESHGTSLLDYLHESLDELRAVAAAKT